MSTPQNLSITISYNVDGTSPVSSAITSPTEPRSRSPSPSSAAPRQTSGSIHSADSRDGTHPNTEPQSAIDPASPTLTSLPPFPSSPKKITKHSQDQSKSFFANLKASKSSNKVHKLEPTIRQVSDETPKGHKDTRENTLYSLRKSPGSTPDLSKSTFGHSSADVNEGEDSPFAEIAGLFC